MARAERNSPETLERGDIFFLYRPRVGEDDPESLEDVQRFFIALRPEGSRKIRLLVVGRKRLPEVESHERLWGFVDMVADSREAVARELGEQRYETRTRGERELPAARPAGEGVYAISRDDGQMRLSYVLELPEKPGDVQREFAIAPEASFILSVKNPEKGQPPGAGLSEEEKAEFPGRIQKEFEGRRFVGEDIRMLDYEKAEFVLIGARTDPDEEYGLRLEPEGEDEAGSDLLRDLRMRKGSRPVEPLFSGQWQ